MIATGVGVVRVFVCDDQADIRAALRNVIGAIPGFSVSGEAANGGECVEGLRAEHFDLLVLDVHLPGGGPGLVAAIRADHPNLPIVVFSADLEAHVQQAMLAAGADAFIAKTGRLAPLRAALLRHARPGVS